MNLKLVATTSILAPSRLSNIARREISTKFFKPHPRPYERRKFEAALSPVIPGPEKNRHCYIRAQYEYPERELLDIEIAMAKHLREYIIKEKFRVMIVCQRFMVHRRTMWFANTNVLLANGLEYREYGKNVMRALLNGTPLESLDVMWTSHSCLLFGSDVKKSLKALVSVVPTVNHLVPLVAVVDDRILTIDQVKELFDVEEKEHRAETVQILQQIPSEFCQILDTPSSELSYILAQMNEKKEEEEVPLKEDKVPPENEEI